MKFINEKAVLICRIAAVFLLVLIVLQFLPYWTYTDGAKASINSYVYFPNEVYELNKWFGEAGQVGRMVETNESVAAPVAVLLLAAIGIIMTIWKPREKWVSLFALATGLAVVIGYPTNLVIPFGDYMYVHIIIGAIVLFLGLVMLVSMINDFSNLMKGRRMISQDTLEASLKKVEIAVSHIKSESVAEADRAYNQLLGWLNDDVREIRVEAIKGLGVSSKEAAITHLAHYIMMEEDKELIKLMRETIVSIRANVAEELKKLEQ